MRNPATKLLALFAFSLAVTLAYAHFQKKSVSAPESVQALDSRPTTQTYAVQALLCEPPTPVLQHPAQQAVNVFATTLLRWDTVADAQSYDLQLATDANFNALVADTTGLPYHLCYLPAPLDTSSTFYWRVRAVNACGASPWTETGVFSTSNHLCFVLESTDTPVHSFWNTSFSSSLLFPYCGTISKLSLRNVSVRANLSRITFQLATPEHAPFNVAIDSCTTRQSTPFNLDEAAAFAFPSSSCSILPGYTYKPIAFPSELYTRPSGGEWSLIVNKSSSTDILDIISNWSIDICITPPDSSIICYRDLDNDGFGDLAETTFYCSTCPLGWIPTTGDCWDYSPDVNPSIPELINEIDDNCNGFIDELQDGDGDGFFVYESAFSYMVDCNDNDIAIHPAAEEVCNDSIDNNCNGLIDEINLFQKWDFIPIFIDGYHAITSTLEIVEPPTNYTNVVVYVNIAHTYTNDLIVTLTNPAGYSAVLVNRVCSGQDNLSLAISLYNGIPTIICPAISGPNTYFRASSPADFSNLFSSSTTSGTWTLKIEDVAFEDGGQLNRWHIHYISASTTTFFDGDGDGYGDDQISAECENISDQWVEQGGDCDDSNPEINLTTTWYIDQDGDGYPGAQTQQSCIRPPRYKLASELVSLLPDCNDANATLTAPSMWYADQDADGYGSGDSLLRCTRPSGYFSASQLISPYGDCNDNPATGGTISPTATEFCDGIDNNCDGIIDPDTGIVYTLAPTAIGEGIVSGELATICNNADAEYTLSADGLPSTSTYDNIQFVHQQMCNNSEIIARINTFEGSGWAGIMIRETLDPGAKKVALSTRMDNKIRREMRLQDNGPTLTYLSNRPGAVWLRLKRTGNTLAGYTSSTGVLWTSLFTRVISMDGCVYLGLFTEGGSGAATEAAFSHVSITGTPPALQQTPTGTSLQQRPPIAAIPMPQLYPNPSGGEFVLSLSAYQEPKGWIEIYDALGRLVQKRPLSGNPEERFALRTEAGVYQVLVKVDGQAPRALRLVMLE